LICLFYLLLFLTLFSYQSNRSNERCQLSLLFARVSTASFQEGCSGRHLWNCIRFFPLSMSVNTSSSSLSTTTTVATSSASINVSSLWESASQSLSSPSPPLWNGITAVGWNRSLPMSTTSIPSLDVNVSHMPPSTKLPNSLKRLLSFLNQPAFRYVFLSYHLI
jgi:hypothetical protein